MRTLELSKYAWKVRAGLEDQSLALSYTEESPSRNQCLVSYTF